MTNFVKKKKEKRNNKERRLQTIRLHSQRKLSVCEAEFAHEKHCALTSRVLLFNSTTHPEEDQSLSSLSDLFWSTSFSFH